MTPAIVFYNQFEIVCDIFLFPILVSFPQVCRLANHFVTQHTHLQFIHGRGVQPILTHAKADEMVISDHLLLLVLGQVCTHTVGHAFLGPDRIKPRKDLRGLGFEICTASTWIHGACPFLFKRRAFIIDLTLFMKTLTFSARMPAFSSPWPWAPLANDRL